MTTLAKLTDAYTTQPVLVNLDLVRTVTREPSDTRAPERSVLWFEGYGEYDESISVVETPDTILAAVVAKGAAS